MLVLSRKVDERIYIGDDVVVTVVEIRGDKVRLGINAPRDIPVERDDIKKGATAPGRRGGRVKPADQPT